MYKCDDDRMSYVAPGMRKDRKWYPAMAANDTQMPAAAA
jgi:hypothetical protein